MLVAVQGDLVGGGAGVELRGAPEGLEQPALAEVAVRGRTSNGQPGTTASALEQ